MTEIYGYIYKIENLTNGKMYIGQTTSHPNKRKRDHFRELGKGTHHNSHLQFAFDKYGESNFKFTVLNYATNKETLNQLEIDYISYYDCLNRFKGYNLQSGGSNGKVSLETRKKLSKSLRGIKRSKEQRERYSKSKMGKKNPNYGKRLSKEARELLLSYSKGLKISKEFRKKTSRGKRGNGLFGFTGIKFIKGANPERRCWQSQIKHKKRARSLGVYEDPLSAEIVYNFVWNEIYSN